MKTGVAVLAIDDDGQAVLTLQFRYASGQISLEAACGSAEAGEEPRQAAERELREELGITAAQWISLGICNLDTSIVRCPYQRR